MRPLLLALVLILLAPPVEALVGGAEAQAVSWNDWRMWSVVAAFLGFTFGTLIKFGFDLWLDRIRERKERLFLAHVIQAEMISLAAHARSSLRQAHKLRATANGEPLLAGTVLSIDLVSASFVHQAGVRLGLLGHASTAKIFRALSIAAHFRGNMDAIRRRAPGDEILPDVMDQFIKELTLAGDTCRAAADTLAEITGQTATSGAQTANEATPQASTE